MKRATLLVFALLLFCPSPAPAQLTADAIRSGIGAPPASRCSAISHVGRKYARKDAQALSATEYTCGQTGVGTFTWELSVASGSVLGWTSKTGTGVEGLGCTNTGLTVGDGWIWNGTSCVNSVFGLPSRADNDGTVVIATTDRNSSVNVGHATANAVSIAQAGVTAGNGFIGGWQTIVCTTGAGLTTITPTTSTINGAATLTVPTNACARIYVPTEADTNYRAIISSSTADKVWSCEIVVGDPGAASAVLADDNDTPGICKNATAVTKTITAVSCYANTGSPTVTPIVNGGSATSILSGALTCTQAAAGAAGSLNGAPTLTTGQLVDMNITTAGGAAKYIVVRIEGTLP